MGKTKKTYTAILTLTIAISCLIILMVKPAIAQTIPKPPTEFTVSFARTLYTVTAPDPVSGVNITQQFQNNTIQVKIDNKQYSSALGGSQYHLYYNIRIKLHSENNWSELYPPESFYNNATNFNSTALNLARTPNASTSGFTTITFYDYYPSYPPNTEIGFVPPFHFPPGTQLDVEVQAIIGVDSQVYVADHPTAPRYGGHYEPAVVVDSASDWSNAHSITIPEEDSSNPAPTAPESNPSLTPDIPRNPPHLDPTYYLIPVSVILAIVIAAILLYRSHRKNANRAK